MAVEYEEIRSKFEELRNFIINDLKLLVGQENGGNYITACLIVCACEALSWLRNGKPHKGELFFSEMVLPQKWQPVASTLYDALRNGIVHGYETMDVVIGPTRVVLAVSWKQKPHLKFLRSGQHVYLYLNIQSMAADMKHALGKYEEELKTNCKQREVFYKAMRQMKNKWEKQPPQEERKTWETLLNGDNWTEWQSAWN